VGTVELWLNVIENLGAWVWTHEYREGKLVVGRLKRKIAGVKEKWRKKMAHDLRFEARAESFHTHPASCDSSFLFYYLCCLLFTSWWLKYFITLVIYNDDKMLYSIHSLLSSDCVVIALLRTSYYDTFRWWQAAMYVLLHN